MRARGYGYRAAPILLSLALLTSCSGGPGSTAPAPDASVGRSGAAPPAVVAAAVSPTGRAAFPLPSDPEVKVRAAWCAVAGSMFPLWVAKEAGIFARHKLDVDIQLVGGADAALMAGEVDFVECAGAA